MALTTEYVQWLIDDKKPTIMSVMGSDPLFMSQLIRTGVVTDVLRNQLATSMGTDFDKAGLILDSVKNRGVTIFIKFCQVLKMPKLGMDHVLDLLGPEAKRAAEEAGDIITASLPPPPLAPPAATPATAASSQMAGQSVLLGDEEMDKLFKKNLPTLRKLHIDEDFIMELVSSNVITDNNMQSITSKGTNIAKVNELMLNILPRKSHSNKILFLQALTSDNINQTYLLKGIGLNTEQINLIKDYKPPEDE